MQRKECKGKILPQKAQRKCKVKGWGLKGLPQRAQRKCSARETKGNERFTAKSAKSKFYCKGYKGTTRQRVGDLKIYRKGRKGNAVQGRQKEMKDLPQRALNEFLPQRTQRKCSARGAKGKFYHKRRKGNAVQGRQKEMKDLPQRALNEFLPQRTQRKCNAKNAKGKFYRKEHKGNAM